jgi:hypothetical protein
MAMKPVMNTITSNTELVAYCGLYCGACGAYLKGKCPGCHKNKKASWCKIRSCCIEHKYSTCAECPDFPSAMDCRKFNNLISKLIGFLLHSDRAACIGQIKQLGVQGHADNMAQNNRHTIRR